MTSAGEGFSVGPSIQGGGVASPAEQSPETARLDWRELAPPPETHYCDCDYCEMTGEEEPRGWPMLVTITIDGDEFVTDRFIAIRVDLAPIPEGYTNVVSRGPDASGNGLFALTVSNDVPIDAPIRWSIGKALQLTGWRLRVIERPTDATARARRVLAVVDGQGEHIGWAVSSAKDVPDERDPGFTWPYREQSTPPGQAL